MTSGKRLSGSLHNLWNKIHPQKALVSNPTLYTFGLSVWSAVPELAVAELYPAGAVDVKVVNLVEGENFAPSFVKLNDQATLPTLEAGGKVYTNTTEVTGYLVEHAPTKVKAGNSALIQKIHEDQYDPNFALLFARSEEELKTKAAGFPLTFVQNRQNALDKYSVTPEAAELKAFYDAKKEGNGGLLAIYKGEVPADVTASFISQSQSVWASITAYILTDLPALLPASGFIGGERPGEDDFHVGAWLARISMVSDVKENVAELEKELGSPVPEKVVAYWNAWTARPAWKKVYAEGLH